MALMLNKLPEDVIFNVIQDFIGKDKIIYYNKYVKEYRFKFNKNNILYNKINKLFENVTIIYNKNTGGTFIEIGYLGGDNILENGYWYGKPQFSITHISYKHKHTLFLTTELRKKFEYFDDYGYDSDGRLDYHDTPYISYKNFYDNTIRI
jgi:hypothetical protein